MCAKKHEKSEEKTMNSTVDEEIRYKYDRLILPVVCRSATELKKHEAGVGTRYVFSDGKNNPGGKVYSILRIVKNVERPPQHVGIHRHSVDSLWMFVGDNDDLTGLEVEVVLGEKTYTLDSPASVYIPRNVEHTYRFIKGSGKYINIVLVPGGNYNEATT